MLRETDSRLQSQKNITLTGSQTLVNLKACHHCATAGMKVTEEKVSRLGSHPESLSLCHDSYM